MKALVTGATGFLGTALTRALGQRGWEAHGFGSAEIDLRDPSALERLGPSRFGAQPFDRIFHLAAWTQAGDFCLSHPGEQWLINQQINTSVLTWWRRHQPQAKLISIGTSCAYEEGEDLREENYLRGDPIADLYVYAQTKRMLLIGQRALARQFGLRQLTVVPSTLYGPGYPVGAKQMHFIFDLAWKILDHKRFGTPVILWGDGQQRRELVLVEDFVTTLLALDQQDETDLVNIGAGEDHAIADFAGLIATIVGVDPAAITYDPARYVGARAKRLSTAKLDQLLPARPRTPLKAGLEATLAWLEERHGRVSV